MGILNYSTSIDFTKTIGEIQRCLVNHGATKIVTDYENNIPIAVTFALQIKENLIAFSLPANYEGVYNAMKKDKKIPTRLLTKEQLFKEFKNDGLLMLKSSNQ